MQAARRFSLQGEKTLQPGMERAQLHTHLEFVDREMVVEQSMVTAGTSIRMTPPVGLPYRACTVRNAPSSLALLRSSCSNADLTLLSYA